MSARDAMLAAIRQGLGVPASNAAAIRREADALLLDADLVRPPLPPGPLSEALMARLLLPKLGATVDRIEHVAEFPAAVERHLRGLGLPLSIALQLADEMRALDWSGFECHGSLDRDEAVGVGLARSAIAETGSLVFHSGPDMPVLLAFLPMHHVVLVRASTVVAHLEDHAAAFAASGEAPPRNLNLVTGPSGTTDIEGVLVRGAHGPGGLHVVVALAA